MIEISELLLPRFAEDLVQQQISNREPASWQLPQILEGHYGIQSVEVKVGR